MSEISNCSRCYVEQKELNARNLSSSQLKNNAKRSMNEPRNCIGDFKETRNELYAIFAVPAKYKILKVEREREREIWINSALPSSSEGGGRSRYLSLSSSDSSEVSDERSGEDWWRRLERGGGGAERRWRTS